MTGWLHAYVDETGTNTLDTSRAGVSAYFITVAVVVNAESVQGLTDHLNVIAQRLCSGAEIKSSAIGGNHPRRRQFLEAIAELDFGYYAMLIRKDAVRKESGLQYKRSFYKCINQMLYRRLTRGGRSIRIVADEIGGRDFMDSFKGYLKGKLKPDLFFNYEHQFADSNQARLIQLADLIAGTLAHCYEPEKRGDHVARFRELLTPKEVAIDCWPPEYRSSGSDEEVHGETNELRRWLMARVERFIRERESAGDLTQHMQVEVLRILWFAREFEKPAQQLISSDRLMRQLEEQGFDPISKRAFTKDIIGGIRMNGVIIAGTKNGYRLAMAKADIRDYLDHNKSIIEPMLARLREARKAVRLDTANDVDIVADEQYQTLKRLLDCTADTGLGLDKREAPHESD